MTLKKMDIPTFDDAIDAFENGGDKAEKRAEAKLAKHSQITARHTDLKNKVIKMEMRLKKSYFDASIDSVQVFMDLGVLRRELEACESIMNALFPKETAEA